MLILLGRHRDWGCIGRCAVPDDTCLEPLHDLNPRRLVLHLRANRRCLQATGSSWSGSNVRVVIVRRPAPSWRKQTVRVLLSRGPPPVHLNSGVTDSWISHLWAPSFVLAQGAWPCPPLSVRPFSPPHLH